MATQKAFMSDQEARYVRRMGEGETFLPVVAYDEALKVLEVSEAGCRVCAYHDATRDPKINATAREALAEALDHFISSEI